MSAVIKIYVSRSNELLVSYIDFIKPKIMPFFLVKKWFFIIMFSLSCFVYFIIIIICLLRRDNTNEHGKSCSGCKDHKAFSFQKAKYKNRSNNQNQFLLTYFSSLPEKDCLIKTSQLSVMKEDILKQPKTKDCWIMSRKILTFLKKHTLYLCNDASKVDWWNLSGME